MGSFSLVHWIIILFIILVLFGANRIGPMMGEMGKGLKAFKEGMRDDEPRQAANNPYPPQQAQAPLPPQGSPAPQGGPAPGYAPPQQPQSAQNGAPAGAPPNYDQQHHVG